MTLSRQDVILGRALLAWNLIDRPRLLACAEEVSRHLAQGRQVTLGQVLVQRGLLSIERYQAIVARLRQLYLDSSVSQQVQRATEQVPNVSPSGRYTRTFQRPSKMEESTIDRAVQGWQQVARSVTASGSGIELEAVPARLAEPAKGPDAAIRRRLKVALDAARFAIGTWVVEQYLADGSWGVVYRVTRQGGDATPYALKVLKHMDPSPEIRQRFIQEARTMARLDHPGIVHVHDGGVTPTGGLLYFVMDFRPGPNLKKVLDESGALPCAGAVRVVDQLCDAVAYAHAQSILHRDLKPENVIMEGDRPILTDFGLAKDSESGMNLTMEGQRIGTPFYMAPELIIEAKKASPQSEVYALGAMLYELVSGKVPFFAKSISQLSKLLEGGKLTPLRKHKPDAPKGLEKLCTRALDKDPRRRPQTVDAFREELAASSA